jgi:methionyl-tRNA formyltransferase
LIKAGPLAGLKPGQAMRDHNSNALLIKCAGPSEELLMVTKVQQAGKRALGVKDWWNGLRGMGKVKVIEMGN